MPPVTFKVAPQPVLELLRLLGWALFGLSFLITLGLGLWWLEVPGLDRLVEEGEEKMSLFPALVLMTVATGLLPFLVSLQASPARNYLLLDDVGLTQVQWGRRKRWLWRDLVAVEVKDRPFGMKAGRLEFTGTFDWRSRLGMLLMNGYPSKGRLITQLPDFYEAPIEEVIARIRQHQDWVLGRGPRRRAVPPTRAVRPSDEPLTFRKSPAKHRGEAVLFYIQYVLAGLVLVLMFAKVVLFPDDLLDDPWSLDAASDWLMGLGGLAMIASSWLTLRALKPERTFLRLEPSGLSYQRNGKSYAWSWQDLSAFEHHVLSRAALLGRRRAITFAAPGKDRPWRLMRWSYGLPKEPPAVIIEDVYDTPLTEIAATLNAHRDHARRSGVG